MKQNSGNNSVNLQAGRDINVVVNNNTIALYSIEEVAKQLMNSVFGELSQITKKQIVANQKSYFQILVNNLQKIKKQNDDLKEVVKSPDFQYISKRVLISVSRSSSTELHKILSSLLVQRINNDNDDLKRIIYNEAITIAEKTTNTQLNVLALFFVFTCLKGCLKYYVGNTEINDITNINHLILYIQQKIKPFASAIKTISGADIAHLQYTVDCLREMPIPKDKYDSLKNMYPKIFPDIASIKKLFLDIGIDKTFDALPLGRIQLTSIGAVLANTYYEQITNESHNIDHMIFT